MLSFNPSYPNLRILDISDQDDAKRLLFLLFDQYEHNNVQELEDERLLQKVINYKNIQSTIIDNLLNIPGLLNASIHTIVVEFDYVDRDTNIAYVQLYARGFRDYPRRTVRLHFFSESINYNDLLNENIIASAYLGFCVLSPARPRTIGRTVLANRHDSSIQCFIPTYSKFSINLAGTHLSVGGTPFIQQDGRVAACASAAIWMSTNMLSRLWNDMTIYSSAEITQIATRYSMPYQYRDQAPGLGLEQMLWALHEMGYEPIVHKGRDYDYRRSKETIYSYLESGIPPILVIYLPGKGHHAITVVGHTYKSNSDQDEMEYQFSKSKSANICYPQLIVHDDQIGPYIKIEITEDNNIQYPILSLDASDPILQHVRDHVSTWYNRASLRYIIAPLPPRHALRPEVAANHGKALLIEAYKMYASRFNLIYPSSPLFRTYFISSNEYKGHFVSGLPDLLPELSTWYRGSLYPRYIWVTELYDFEQYASTPKDLRVIADVAIDATSSPFMEGFVTLHIPKLFFRMSPFDTNVAKALHRPVGFFLHDTPYQPFMRY